ncbi:TPA: hypothetical protein SMI16_003843 [Serratia liquefaciens]|nr:hypothetical protein [Serratia liquefaciens]
MTQTLTTDELRQIVETDHTQCGDAAAMARELLDNREAQPVVCDIERIKRHALPAGECPKQSQVVLLSSLKRLLTAPPAPAVPETINTAIRYLKDTLVACNRFNYCADAVNRVEDAFRAAMLAQPVSQGCKLAPVPTVKKFIPVSSVSSTVNGTEPFPAALTCEEAAALDGTIFLSHLKPGGMVQVYAAVGKDDDRELIAFNPKDFKFTAPEGGN